MRVYAPNPTKKQMQHAPRGYGENMSRYTAIQLPRRGESATDELGGPGFVREGAARGARPSSCRSGTPFRTGGGRAPTG